MVVPCGVERLQQRGDSECRRRLSVAAEPKREHHVAAVEFAEECDVPWPCLHIVQVMAPLAAKSCQPSLTPMNPHWRAPTHLAARSHRRRRQGNGIRTLFRAQYLAVMVHEYFGHSFAAVALKMRREQSVKFKVGVAGQSRFDQQDVAHKVGRDPQAEFEAWVLVQNFDGRDAGTGRCDAVIGVPLDLDPEAVPSATMNPRSRTCGMSTRG